MPLSTWANKSNGHGVTGTAIPGCGGPSCAGGYDAVSGKSRVVTFFDTHGIGCASLEKSIWTCTAWSKSTCGMLAPLSESAAPQRRPGTRTPGYLQWRYRREETRGSRGARRRYPSSPFGATSQGPRSTSAPHTKPRCAKRRPSPHAPIHHGATTCLLGGGGKS